MTARNAVTLCLLATALHAQGFMPGGGGASGPSDVPGNIYNWGFETCHPYPAADTSNFNDGSGHSVFSPSVHYTTPWSCDSVDAAALGSRSIQHAWTISAGNQGYEVDYELGTAQESLFVIQAVYFSSPFDSGASAHCNATSQSQCNFSDFVKQLRLIQPGFTGAQIAGIGPAPDGVTSAGDGVATHWTVSSDGLYDSQGTFYEANCNRASEPNPKSLMGSWHFFELYVNTQNDTAHVPVKIWIDGTQYWNVDWRYYPPDTTHCLPGTTPNPNWVKGNGYQIGDLYMFGVINSVAGTPTVVNLDELRLGTNSNMTHKPFVSSNP